MKKRWKMSKIFLALPILAALLTSASAIAGPAPLCEELSRFSLQSAAGTSGIDRYQLSSTLNRGLEYYNNLDIDGDDISDFIEKGCPGSTNMPADPCSLSMKLSSSGKTFEFEAWGFLLFRYKGQIFIAANADETRTKTNIYRVIKTGFKLVCAKL